ncbi:MAG: hypothetical protein HN344_11030, partial [Gammaproteobacteria bacterium]|nr:hypothetical protein [Gammaproteobacteria bacterium]
MRWPFRRFGLIPLLLTSSLAPGLAWGAELPQPLTLQHAISLAASAEHPSLQQLQATTNQARIALEQIESRQGASVDLTGRLRWKRLQQQGDATLDDHLLTLSARKPLYDFGYSALESQIASAWIGQRQSEQQQQIESRKLLILENFFAVLLTDLQRTLDDETMTIAYLRFKKKEDKAP